MSDVKNLEKVYYVIDGDDIVGHLKLYVLGTLPSCFEDTYKFYLKSYLKEKLNDDIDLNDYTNTFKIDGAYYFEDFVKFERNRYNVRLHSLGVPYLDNIPVPNRYSCNLTRLVKHKTQFYNFIIDVDKPETNRLFYDSDKDNFFVVDCSKKEIEKFYTNIIKRVGVRSIDILDKSNNVVSVKISDVLNFCKKELDVISTQNNLYHKNLRLFDRLSTIFYSEGFSNFLKIYKEGLR